MVDHESCIGKVVAGSVGIVGIGSENGVPRRRVMLPVRGAPDVFCGNSLRRRQAFKIARG